MNAPSCRFCLAPLTHTFINLGLSPISNAYPKPEQLSQPEAMHPLHAYVCAQCFLVQIEEFTPPEILFSDYTYFSSYSESWLAHCQAYSAEMLARYGLGPQSQVIEVASNDGYLLQYFAQADIPVLGIEPAANVAAVAQARGIPTEAVFFNTATAQDLIKRGIQADLLVGNNVLAHTPSLRDFVTALAQVLKPQGVLTMEFPHLLALINGKQFDTIYHEHFSYFSFLSVNALFAWAGLQIFDVESLPTHGGSLRIHAQLQASGTQPLHPRVPQLQRQEAAAGLDQIDTYTGFDTQAQACKAELRATLQQLKEAGKQVVGYGAPAKGTTLLNYCQIGRELLDYTVDISPHKQGRYMPGVHIPIFAPDHLRATRPDYVLILPWNLRSEIMQQLADIRTWGGQFIVPIPEVRIQ